MAAMRGPRLQVGSSAWIAEERSSALQIVQSEVEEFSFSVRNEAEWLNEHMAGIFNENEVNFAEAFKTPGKLRGKTPRTIRKADPSRLPLSDVFASTTPNGAPHLVNKITSPNLHDSENNRPDVTTKIVAQKASQPSQPVQDSGYASQDILAPSFIDLGSSPIMSSAKTCEKYDTEAIEYSPTRFNPLKSPGGSDQKLTEARPQSRATYRHHNLGNDMSSSPLKYVRTGSMNEPTKEQDDEPDTICSQPHLPSTDQPDIRSPSEASSPIRPMVRKSSINFASLPAREPLAAAKVAGGRVPRVSHLDHGRTIPYQRPTSDTNSGSLTKTNDSEDTNWIKPGVEEDAVLAGVAMTETDGSSHAKTYTQRLQDQINLLGKSKSNAMIQSMSLPNVKAAQGTLLTKSKTFAGTPIISPNRKESIQQTMQTTPGAFPEDDDDDDDDDWIEPPTTVAKDTRPALAKSHSADVMEGIHDKETIGQPEFVKSNVDVPAPGDVTAHGEFSRATPSSKLPTAQSGTTLSKQISMLNMRLTAVPEKGGDVPPGSPSRLFRDSPLKQVKNKLSSILKSSKSLLASSAAISAEGKSILSPSVARLGMQATGMSSESMLSIHKIASHKSLRSEAEGSASPSRSIPRRPQQVAQKERDDKMRETQAISMATEQMAKLERAREQEREKARVFSKEQERIQAMEQEIAKQKQVERKPLPKEPAKPVRSSPRKPKDAEEDFRYESVDREVEMMDAEPPTPTTSKVTSVAGHALRNRDGKRPMKPAREAPVKAKLVPTVIRVNTGSQHSQLHPSTRQSIGQQETTTTVTVAPQPPQLASFASKPNLQTKTSTQSLRSASSARSKIGETAAKKAEQEEREQRRREAKAEADRKKLAAQEEQRRQEQQRRVEAERQKQKERDQVEEKKNAQRQAAIEKAKQTKAPPPAMRSQPNGPPDFAVGQQKPLPAFNAQKFDNQGARPPSRMGPPTQRGPEEASRFTVAGSTKALGQKRVAGPDEAEDLHNRGVVRIAPTYQAKDAKRRRTSDRGGEDDYESGGVQHMKAQPVRPSVGLKKDVPSKSLFQNGYSAAPPSATLFKATVASQHSNQKASHPLDMAQVSKGGIPFAPNPHLASSASAYKTPARPGQFYAAKSAAKSVSRPSPQFQNGESIELPEIQTDDEDEEDDGGNFPDVDWVNSPALRGALMRQETIDPMQIFGAPGPLNMEEVFNKTKDRWQKFRARTSSANWSGFDRLTEEDIRKDMAAREKLRREGGWSYEMSRDMV